MPGYLARCVERVILCFENGANAKIKRCKDVSEFCFGRRDMVVEDNKRVKLTEK